jgi:hypothetical protein
MIKNSCLKVLYYWRIAGQACINVKNVAEGGEYDE